MKYRFIKFLHTDVAWNRRRLLSTAAVRDLPIVARKTRKKVPKAERKAMVNDYVNKYRVINAGKFPGVENTRHQVGGSYYTIRAILQELKHNYNLSGVVIADDNSVVESAAQRNDISAFKEILDSVTPLDKIVEPEDYGDLSENGINCPQKMDNDCSEKTVAMPILTRTKDASVEDVFVNQTTIDSGLESQVDRTRGGLVEVLKEQRLVEKTSPEIILMESATEDFKLYEKSGVPSEGLGTSSSVFVENDRASVQAPEFTVRMVPDPANAKKQDDGSMLPAVEIINETSIMRQTAEADQISEPRETLDHQVTMDRTTITDNGGFSAGTGPTSRRELKTSHCQMKLDMSSMTMFSSTTEVVSGSDTIIDLEFERTSAVGVDKARSKIVFDDSNLVEKNSADESVKASETESSQFCENRSYPSEVVGGALDTRSGDAITTSPTASITDGYSRGTTIQKTHEKELQGTLWGNLKSMASRFINIWRKT